MTSHTHHSVSVIGLGAMGSGIARTFIDAGCRVSVWNRSRGKIDALVADGATGCDTPADALEANRHVVVCVSDYATWSGIVEEHGLRNQLDGTCVIQLTGGTIDDVREHEAFIKGNGGHIADGAVMCFPQQLGTDDASLLMSGEPDVLEECEPLLDMLAPRWTNLGDDITRPAVLSRALTAGILTSFIGFLNGIAMCQKGGIPLDTYMEHTEIAGAIVPDEKRRLLEAVRDGKTEQTQASLNTWAGAHQTIHAVAASLGTHLVLQDAIKSVLQHGQRMQLGEHDLAALTSVFGTKVE